MKNLPKLAILVAALLPTPSCDSAKKSTPAPQVAIASAQGDIPLLTVVPGDVWHYKVHLEIPEGVSSPGAASVDQTFERVRTYIGKIIPAGGLPEVDCFEVTVPGSPVEREFVEIRDDVILMRGSMIMRPSTTQPLWLDHPVPLVVAGMKPGTESPDVTAPGGSMSRKTQVVAREIAHLPAGDFPSIRLLMTGTDGEIELRRVIWFTPGVGIVREEKTRYRKSRVIYRETQELEKTSVKPRAL